MFKAFATEIRGFILEPTVRNGLPAYRRQYFDMGYQVGAYVGGDMDTPIETIYHSAVFRTRSEADRFAARVTAKHQATWPNPFLNLKHWIISEATDLAAGYRRKAGEEQPPYYSPLPKGYFNEVQARR